MATLNERGERVLTPPEAAACLIYVLENRGAWFRWLPNGHFWCDLDGSNVATHEEAECIAACVLTLRDEITKILISRRTPH